MKVQKQKIRKSEGRDLSIRTHRRLIGFLGLLLPVLIYVISGIRVTNSLTPWKLLHSVSAYYYTGAIGIFVGMLFALSLFLFSYRGYTKDIADRIIGKIAGVAALGVALVPTEAPDVFLSLCWWRPYMTIVHNVSAIVLFSSFILFSVWLFRKSAIAKAKDRPIEKQWRDRICLLCGIVMGGGLLWAASSLITGAPMFWPETIAIEAFAVSWLAKGDIHQPFVHFWKQVRSKA